MRVQERVFPADWEATTMGAVADYLNGYPFKPRDWVSVGLPIVRIAQMTDPSAATDYFHGALPAEYRIDNGDLLFSWSATLMAMIWQRGPAYLNQHIYKVVPRDGNDVRFLHHLLDRLIEPLASQTHGTTMKHVTRGDMLPFPVTIPAPSEQRRIAAVLDTVDAAIAKTEAVIAKLKCVRAGLLHDLLTRGLDAGGQLRPPYDQAPQLYNDSPLGQVPREWHISTVGGEFPLQRGFDITVSQQRDGDVPVVSSSGINSYHDTAMVRGPGVVTGRKGKLGDTYFIEGDFWPHDTSLWVTDFFGNSERFCALLLKHMRLERLDAATSVPTLNRNNVHPLTIALPRRSEQDRIVRRVSLFDDGVSSEMRLVTKMQEIKSGLTSDLLTGRVRVPEGVFA